MGYSYTEIRSLQYDIPQVTLTLHCREPTNCWETNHVHTSHRTASKQTFLRLVKHTQYRGSSDITKTRLWAGRPRFNSPQVQKWNFFLFATPSGPVLGPNQPPNQGVRRDLSPGDKADHSPPTCAEVKNAWSQTSTPSTSSWHGA
jgi:hypothetical protein